jgi:hypothetical protein
MVLRYLSGARTPTRRWIPLAREVATWTKGGRGKKDSVGTGQAPIETMVRFAAT